jgi:hypothetical protein
MVMLLCWNIGWVVLGVCGCSKGFELVNYLREGKRVFVLGLNPWALFPFVALGGGGGGGGLMCVAV